MKLISSMGGCASTSLIHWFSRRCECNCPVNSEGIRRKGPGANKRGLKHRITPPLNDDPYLLKENSYNRTNINFGKIDRAVYFYDSPFAVTLSLFRRRLAMGHAIAIHGKRPPHKNDLDTFLDLGVDSFKFNEKFENWTDENNKREYKRLIVSFSSLWENADYILEFLNIDKSNLKNFPKKRNRENRFDSLESNKQKKLKKIYGELDDKMKSYPGIVVI